jgi:hypothetical protein
VKRELAARDHIIVGFFVDLGLVGGGRERPDAQTCARECAELAFFFLIQCCSGECCSTLVVIRIGVECVGAETVSVTRFKIKGIAPLSVYRLLCLRIRWPG